MNKLILLFVLCFSVTISASEDNFVDEWIDCPPNVARLYVCRPKPLCVRFFREHPCACYVVGFFAFNASAAFLYWLGGWSEYLYRHSDL